MHHQLGFELELGSLELKERLLDADGGEEDEVRRAVLLACEETVLGRFVVDLPRVFDASVAASETGDDDVDA